MADARTTTVADLVLSGGGVKGIGLAGAVVALKDAGYSVKRVSGVSAGSVVGSILAAASNGDQLTAEEIKELALGLPYHKFRDAGPLERIPLLGQAWGLLRETGLYRGDFAHDWVRSELKNLGVTTFGDLAFDDDYLIPERRYRLVVTVADVTTGQLVRLPWDYRRVYGLDPDEQPVADAVRASMAIPFYFRPVTLTGADGRKSTLVDGGVLSSFPIDSFDRPDRSPPRWPTFGITVMPNLPEGNDQVIPALGVLRLLGPPSLLERLITTILVGRDQAYLNQPWVDARTIRVDSTEVNFLDFGISRQDAEALFDKGYEAAHAFISTWDWAEYLERFRRLRASVARA
ncbi:phospholipase [Mycobacterium heckeshornense]|uniref:Membrane protein n=1 Tax=Mycobacterium heckeshornense TaxID=110505 RepID=A0A2G8BJE9_9MYCO|nr:patatin-like phospholipase family protein [Mycobacterium heckeshornense]KMV23752.1 phospholipase [Mycobacterium heckeshornense]MCV7033595.1 patatin-like phospholipase family protein [Mycobacterium heckeshornense]PIJ37736.1 phospholipase [Mycobacterium heckeshornense]BCO37651.1 membrane protein [Mycobacterium heckeshornense]BCQ10501.1 membrane protein [Mycobacterium heckeshornense]